MAMDGLVGGRLGMAAIGLGIAEKAMTKAIGYANSRQAFGKKNCFHVCDSGKTCRYEYWT